MITLRLIVLMLCVSQYTLAQLINSNTPYHGGPGDGYASTALHFVSTSLDQFPADIETSLLYPNPAHEGDVIRIASKSNLLKSCQIQLISHTGQLIELSESFDAEIRIKAPPAATYRLVFQCDAKQIHSEKLIVFP